MKAMLVFFGLFCVSILQGQTKTDSLKNLILESYKNDPYDNHKDVLRYSTELYYLSKKNNTDDILFSLFEQSRIYFMENKFDVTLIKIREGIRISKEAKNYNMLCRFSLIYHNLLVQLNFFQEGKQILKLSCDFNKLVRNENDIHINNVYILTAKANTFVNNEGLGDDMQKVVNLKKKAYQESLKITNKTALKNFTQIYALQSLSWSCALDKRFKESELYLNKADSLLKINPNYYFSIDCLITRGAIENIQRNHNQAINYLQETLERSERSQALYKMYTVYPMISAAYGELGDYQTALRYSWKHKNLADYLQNLKINGNNINIINSINKELSNKSHNDEWNIWFWFGTIIVFVVSGFLIFRFYYMRSNNKKYLEDENEVLTYSENDLDLNKNLISLAKEDVNAFYIEFEKCYPEFHKKLKDGFPELNLSDINFCSLIKMRFDIKQIAIYTKSTLRSVESRRYRIRRKMQLQGQDDLYIFISNLN